jgi:hypothetical protein
MECMAKQVAGIIENTGTINENMGGRAKKTQEISPFNNKATHCGS